MDDIQQAADAAGISVADVTRNIQDGSSERAPVAAAATSQSDGISRGQQSGYAGQQPGATGGQGTQSDKEKPFAEDERTQREF
jgi:hypothetical protein